MITRGRGPTVDGVHRIAVTRLGWFFGTLAWTRRAATCDVVHCQSGEALPLLIALRCWPGRRARILATFHVDNRRMTAAEAPYTLAGERFGREPSLTRRMASALHRGVDAAGLALADAVNAVARATAIDLLGAERGAAARVIHNGVAPPQTTDAVAEPVALFYAGLATHRKRVLTLPFVLAHVRNRHPEARLRIAGFDREAAPELHALFQRLGVAEAVEYLGPQPAAALPAHYRAARVALVPSAYEGLPYAILEALREGTPVVATPVGGHPEILRNGENGFLVPVDDPEAMAERCCEILSDASLAERLGQAARQTVAREFSLAGQIDAYLDCYRSLAERPD
ncbi:MAG: glycosyltransferase family 4 protein [Deltaproteobacteria bacterium]|nr:glycosyltransferase family 4 protein [Deltaproteobacteria bacterium]MBW2360283.1 glycosyltransferase family 4 protein [Deltaproteobacteria bacterium]